MTQDEIKSICYFLSKNRADKTVYVCKDSPIKGLYYGYKFETIPCLFGMVASGGSYPFSGKDVPINDVLNIAIAIEKTVIHGNLVRSISSNNLYYVHGNDHDFSFIELDEQ